ncbi:hypothetical protein NKF25_09515 [Haladaptatus sp. AB643]|uniref:hypothetical protein n=1 Tax=Haladaptatus sp. AB618 TaxID=2934173 RepID=UPI00209C0923|nr:hypothetical protein [Haladaptatus sp. AB643]
MLAPVWYFSLAAGEEKSPVVLSSNKGSIAPNETFLPTPVEVGEFAAGVVSWAALFVLVGMLYYTNQFIRVIGRSSGSIATDGGINLNLPSYLTSDGRWIADFWPAEYSTPGIIGIALTAWSTVVFAALFGLETFGYARTQFLGIYAGMMFLSIGAMTAIYTTWFIPDMVVVEDRSH